MKIELPMTPIVADVNQGKDSPGEHSDTEPQNPECVVCGGDNAHGLKIVFEVRPDGSAADWIPRKGWESYRGIIHGGIISAVLDEAMSKALIARGHEALTAELRVRFKDKVSVGDALRVRGWVVEIRKRIILAEASLCKDSGVEIAHAWGSFLVPRSVSKDV